MTKTAGPRGNITVGVALPATLDKCHAAITELSTRNATLQREHRALTEELRRLREAAGKRPSR